MNIKLLAVTITLAAAMSAQALNDRYYFDRNGPTVGAGLANGASYVWDKTNPSWNDTKAGDDAAGLGTIITWPDVAELGYAEGDPAARSDVKRAIFAAGGSNVTYNVTIPNGEMRDCYRVETFRDQVTLSGTLRVLDPDSYAAGFIAEGPGVLTLSNLIVVSSNAPLLRFQDSSPQSYNARFRIDPTTQLGGKALFINGYTVLDFSSLPDIGVIWTTNNPDGIPIQSVQFHGYGDNNILQGRGNITVQLGSWIYNTNAHIGWRPDGFGNAQGGGFSAKGGKLTVNLFGDNRIVPWYRPELDGAVPGVSTGETNVFVGGKNGQVFNLLLGGFETDSEVELQNGIDIRGGVARLKVLTPASPNGFATISGSLVDSVGGASLIKVGQNAFQASGTLILSGTNTYRGSTAIQEGKLVITSAHQGGGAVIVSNNATLGVRVTSASTIPMAALTLSKAGTNAAKLEFDYLAASSAPVIWATNFTAWGTNATFITVKGGLSLGQVPLIKYGGAIGGNGFAGLLLAPLPAGYTGTLVDNFANSTVDLNITAVPTPPSVNITKIVVNGSTVKIDFVAGAADAASNFKLQCSGNAAAGFSDDSGATITGTAPNFQATTATNGGAQFYRIRR